MIKLFPTGPTESVTPERMAALAAFGLTERQARFLVNVLLFSGVFIERQYRAFTGLAHGQKVHDFLTTLVAKGYATAITPGALHRGRLYHVHYKPLYEAIGEPNNRHRRPASLGRFVERLMLLDAVLADRRVDWLGTERDKLGYFRGALDYTLLDDWYPHLTFGTGASTTRRFFPDKLPIGVPRGYGHPHVFLYLVTREVPTEFRMFLLRHADLLGAVGRWAMRLLMPRRFRKAAALYRYAVRDTYLMPLEMREVEELHWYFRARRGEVVYPVRNREFDVPTFARKFSAARFEALYRTWLQRDVNVLWSIQTHVLRDQLQRREGRVEFVELPHQYLQLTPFVGTSDTVEKGLSLADDLISA